MKNFQLDKQETIDTQLAKICERSNIMIENRGKRMEELVKSQHLQAKLLNDLIV